MEDHVILPFEYFIELQAAADNSPPPTAGQRVGTTLQTTAVVLGISLAVTAGSWGWAKAMDWLDEKRFQRKNARTFRPTQK